VIQLHDPKEADPEFLGDAEFVDVETGTARKVTITERNLKTYKNCLPIIRPLYETTAVPILVAARSLRRPFHSMNLFCE